MYEGCHDADPTMITSGRSTMSVAMSTGCMFSSRVWNRGPTSPTLTASARLEFVISKDAAQSKKAPAMDHLDTDMGVSFNVGRLPNGSHGKPITYKSDVKCLFRGDGADPRHRDLGDPVQQRLSGLIHWPVAQAETVAAARKYL